MSLDFGKLNFSTSFNPTSAFPIDARSYFESYVDAVNAAASAKPAGSTESVYYYGQTLVVVEANHANFYIIQPDNTLSEVGRSSDLGTASLKRKIVSSVEEIEEYMANNDDAESYIFMIPSDFSDSKYEEYIVVTITDNEGIETRLVEKVGSWNVNLEDYAKKTDLDNKVDKVNGSSLVKNADIEKLSGLANIQTIDGHFQLNEGKVSLQDIPVSKVVNLDGILNSGQATSGGYYLVSQKDKDKLEALVLENGELEISGTVNAYNVSELDQWIQAHANIVPGLSEKNFTTELHTKLTNVQEGAEKNYIRTVSDEFSVSSEGQLNINSIGISKVFNLQSALDEKANRDQLIALSNNVDGLTERLTWNTFNE